MFVDWIKNSKEREWMADAACQGLSLEYFFPSEEEAEDSEMARPRRGAYDRGKEVCDQCSVKRRCLEYALKQDERFGLWGGVSPRDRLRIRRGHSRLVGKGNDFKVVHTNRAKEPEEE